MMSCMAHLQLQQLCLASVDKQNNQKNQPHHFGVTNTVTANIVIQGWKKKSKQLSFFACPGQLLAHLG